MAAPFPAAHAGRSAVLDGGLATELQRHGAAVRDPWWSAAALRDGPGRALVREVHAGYVDAGADVMTANTFRCNLRALRRAGLDDPAAGRLVDAAVALARAAASGSPRVRVAGSMAPVEDCYRPSLVPDAAALRREHRWLAERLVSAGVDLVLIETMNTVREAAAALAAVLAAGGRAWVSFVCAPDGRLLSGEDVASAATAMAGAGADVVLVNCATVADTETALRRMRAAYVGPAGAYPNLEDRSGIPTATAVDRYVPPGTGPAEFARVAVRWQDEFGLAALGGCCGATPAHIATLRARLGAGGAPVTSASRR